MRPASRALQAALPIVGRTCAALFLSSLAVACTQPQDRAVPRIDCSPLEADSPYEFGPIVTSFWFSYGDDAPSAARSTEMAEDNALANPPGTDDFSDFPAELRDRLQTEEPCNAWLMLQQDAAEIGATVENNLRFLWPKARDSAARCTSTKARESSRKARGSGFGTAVSQRGHGTPEGLLNPAIPQPRDGSEWQGIAFWAKSAPQKDRTVTVELQTAQTTKPEDGSIGFLTDNLWMRSCLAEKYGLPLPPQRIDEHPCDCREPAEADGALNARVNPDGTLTVEGAEPRPGDCGNSFRQQVTVSTRWQLYLLPFDEFWQEARPNRVSEALDSSAVYQLGLRVDIEKDVDMLTSQWVFYRHEDFEAKERASTAADCKAPDWDISYPEEPDDFEPSSEGDPVTECAMQRDIE